MVWKSMREGPSPLFIICRAVPNLGEETAVFSQTPYCMGADGKEG